MSTGRQQGPASWTTPADIEKRIGRRWDSGELLRNHAAGAPFATIDVPLRGPSSADLTEHLDEARRWVSGLERAAEGGAGFRLVEKHVGGRSLGRTQLPGRALIESYEQAWRMLGVAGRDGDVERFDDVLRRSALIPAARDWVIAHPLKAIELADEWPAILAARDWLEWNRGTGKFLREIDAPGVDTKLVERRRGVLAEMLGVSGRAEEFLTGLGLGRKPVMVRMRFDPSLFGLPVELSEASFRVQELTRLQPPVERALIVENEISYLSAPIPERGVVLWGRGFDAVAPASLAWLGAAAARGEVRYWGDLDTHGFAILNRVRAQLPGVRSVLMDRSTLLAHEERWGTEPSPTSAMLPNLTDTEASLFNDLVSDRYAPRLRLEQERIDWDWVLDALGR
ncbi:Wadjet anti-phage system protein JetD domain-containing protein [Gulosibacter molinativorax]|uniref:DUF3322 and DUF2220 domain-containing protein n=1 Tax=Gulosibacter molinativorax TaxID=256821 RepID=A0ABT7C9V2_9MICO|nr:Wadjet anti-phage system protein JetD domain-containing protein [Gulosibacter molinativorax]MDJ1371893.1 hypothetical protein [Gulosibacter molinativorax]QUY62542.1 Hypotetical protein [Gulosibacter molinativorax]